MRVVIKRDCLAPLLRPYDVPHSVTPIISSNRVTSAGT